MNTIKIYLAEDGSLATLLKDFDLYQYEYQNKLLNVYVPTSICAGPFVDNNLTTGYSCQIKMNAQTSFGAEKITGNFYMRYVKTLTQSGVEYALFERLLPYAFTIFSGVQGNAPQLTISVVNITFVEDDGNTIPKVLSVTNSQTCALEVNPSTAVQSEVPEDPSELDTLEALYQDIADNLPLKQDKEDEDINPDGNDHTVVGNINTLLRDVSQNTNDIGDLKEDMTQAQTDIENLYRAVGGGVQIVGTMTVQDALPSDQDVTDFVEQETGEAPQSGTAVFVIVDYTSGTDTIYLYFFDGTNWGHFEIQYLNSAGNGVKGILQGDYTVSGLSIADNFMVDIVSGVIKNIYRVDADGNYTDFKTIGDQVLAKLINGTSAVEMAKKDASGNVITSTYMRKDEGVTPSDMEAYAMPKALYDINYADYNGSEFKDENVNDTSYNKTVLVSQTGYTTLAIMTMDLLADIALGKQNGCTNHIWINAASNDNVKIRVITQYTDSDNQVQTLSTSLSDTIALVGNTPKFIQIESIFDGLTTPIVLEAGTEIAQTIQIWRETSSAYNVTLLSNDTYPAYMALNKLGFVRYSMEAEPTYFENGTGTTTDAGSILRVRGTGEMQFGNGNSQNLTTQINIPVATSLANNEPRPPKASVVYTALANKADKWTIDTSATSPITLGKFTSHRPSSALSSLTINLPATIDLDFESEIIYSTDSTSPASLTDNTLATYTGDDVTAGQFDPQPSKKYCVFYYNASASSTPDIQAIVRGV